MKSIDKIPTSKISRAANLIKTGAKVGGNYVAYYGEKLVNPDLTKEKLDKNNASDIYDGLKKLKGSALKVAQMLSMEKNVIPQAYSKEFAQAQYSVPPLSGPLVKKTFRKYFGDNPENVFESFDLNSFKAATIGQVHKAKLKGEELAVKIQYPGVADSISSDLAIVKPIAIRMFNLQGKDSDRYFKEVENKLVEETKYELEVDRSLLISKACKVIPHLVFPKYFKEYSNDKVITMSWIHGAQLSEFTAVNKDTELANKIGQTLWDFYMYQMHALKMVHADPHPGNFLITPEENKLGVIDFGCIKEMPDGFYQPYFELTNHDVLENDEKFEANLKVLEILRDDDTQDEYSFFKELFHEMLTTFAEPFKEDEFDFGDEKFFKKLANFGTKYEGSKEIKKYNGNRGSEHLLYMNRTFFGLYNLLNDLGAKVQVNDYKKYLD